MALNPWRPETGWPHLCEGQALYDIRFIAGNFRTHHAMLVRAGPAGAAKVMDGFRVRVTHMGPPMFFSEGDSQATWPLSDTVYLGSFSGPAFDGERYLRLSEEMRRVENRAASTSRRAYSLANLGDDDDPNNPGETVEVPYRSCASLVEGCYNRAGVTLVDKSNLPPYSITEIQAEFCPHDTHGTPIYGKDHLRRMLPKLGLALDREPWPLLLPAYQMHAFQKGDATRPHRAEKTDHPFRPPSLPAPTEDSAPTPPTAPLPPHQPQGA